MKVSIIASSDMGTIIGNDVTLLKLYFEMYK